MIISKSQADKLMRLNLVQFLKNVSAEPDYINSAYSTILKKKQIQLCNLIKEIRSNKETIKKKRGYHVKGK